MFSETNLLVTIMMQIDQNNTNHRKCKLCTNETTRCKGSVFLITKTSFSSVQLGPSSKTDLL